MRRLRYTIRRWQEGGLACHVPECPGATVGASIWCRIHTDEIVAGRQSPEVHAALARLRHALDRPQEDP